MKYGCGNTPNIGDEIRYRYGRPQIFQEQDTSFVNRICVDMGIDCICVSGGHDVYPSRWFDLVSRLADRELRTSPVLFLDIDGVLNGHESYATGYSGIHRDRAEILNQIIAAVPDVKLVISSAWRYMILQGVMTLKGFEYMLLIHGVLAHGRVAGHTEADGPLENEPPHTDRELWSEIGLDMRAKQILKFVAEHKIERWAAVDDLALTGLSNLVRTDGTIGITSSNADCVIELLSAHVAAVSD